MESIRMGGFLRIVPGKILEILQPIGNLLEAGFSEEADDFTRAWCGWPSSTGGVALAVTVEERAVSRRGSIFIAHFQGHAQPPRDRGR